MNIDTLHKDFSLKAHNTFGLKVKSKFYLPYSSEESLLRFLPEINEFKLKTLLMGEGSNLLFLSDFNGIILHSHIKGFEIVQESGDEVEVRVGAGVIWDDFVAWAVSQGYGRVENLSGIPGTIGASPVQNIGAYGVEAKDVITKVEGIELASGQKRSFTAEECQFGYRDSIFKHELKGKYAMSYVSFKLSKKPEFNLSYGHLDELLGKQPATLARVRQVIIEVRNSKIPDYKSLGNAGSFFKNPYLSIEDYEKLKTFYPSMPHYPINPKEVKVPAAWLIDHAGLKGFQHGGAAVHKDQALVIVNTGEASGQDIAELAAIIVNRVEDMYGISLEAEVNFIA